MKGIQTLLWQYLRTKYLQKFRDRSHLLSWQDRKVRDFLKSILPKSAFYQNYYQGLEIRNWQQFPLINKSIMMANFDSLNTTEITQQEAFAFALEAEKTRNFRAKIREFTIGLSSGTSGNRGLFIVSPREQQIWAGTILAKALPQSLLVPEKIAFFLRANSQLYETVKQRHLQFQYFDLFASIESHLEGLNRYQPTILVGPPSLLRLLAEAQAQKQLKIAPLKLISVAEVLDPLDEIYISQVFGQIVHQIYQCTEGFLGSTCQYGTLHLNEDIVAFQKYYLDEKAGKFMPIITDFNRTTQPIVRYHLDDILTERREPCPCGSVFMAIERIEGRKDDIFYFPNPSGEKLLPLFPDFIRRAIISASKEIQEYQVVQSNPRLIQIFLRVPSELAKVTETQVHQSLLTLFTKAGCQIPEIHYNKWQARSNHSQKLRRVRREFKLES